MNAATIDIREGMEVYSSDGEKIGSVSQVWTGVTDASTDIQSAGYFKVDQGGILGLGAKHLYVPYSAVDDVVPGDCVTVNCTKDQCGDLYEQEPDFLQTT
jgi:hypothetical protein